jgi:hypothetical protein
MTSLATSSPVIGRRSLISIRIFRSVCKIDTPYGPYADGFPMEQHLLGPFGPIQVRVKELAAETRTAHAGEPDNGSPEGADR